MHGNFQMLKVFADAGYMDQCEYAESFIRDVVAECPPGAKLDSSSYDQGHESNINVSPQLICLKYVFGLPTTQSPPLEVYNARRAMIGSLSTGRLDIFRWILAKVESGEVASSEGTFDTANIRMDWGFEMVMAAINSMKREVVEFVHHAAGFSGLALDGECHRKIVGDSGDSTDDDFNEEFLGINVLPTLRPVDSAILTGQSEIVEYLVGLGYLYTYRSFQHAAMKGHLGILQVLHQHQQDTGLKLVDEPDLKTKFGEFNKRPLADLTFSNANDMFSSVPAIDLAAFAGNLNAVKFLREQRQEICTVYAPYIAAQHGRLDVFKYLYQQRMPRLSALDAAGEEGGGKTGFYDSLIRLREVILYGLSVSDNVEFFRFAFQLCTGLEIKIHASNDASIHIDEIQTVSVTKLAALGAEWPTFWTECFIPFACQRNPPPLKILHHVLKHHLTMEIQVSGGSLNSCLNSSPSMLPAILKCFFLAFQNEHQNSVSLLELLFRYTVPRSRCEKCGTMTKNCLRSNLFATTYMKQTFCQCISWIAHCGNLEKLLWIESRLLPISCYNETHAPDSRDAVLRQRESQELKISFRSLLTLCQKGYLNVFKKLESLSMLPNTPQPTPEPFDTNNISETNKFYEMSAMDYAASEGHLDLLMYLHQLSSLNSSSSFSDASNTSVDSLYPWLTLSHKALDLASTNGHLEIVVFIHHNNFPGSNHQTFTTDAIDGAARNGHLEIVQFLTENRNEGCTHRAMDSAGQNGYLPVLKYLWKMKPWRKRNQDGNVDGKRRRKKVGAWTSVIWNCGNEATLNWMEENLRAGEEDDEDAEKEEEEEEEGDIRTFKVM
jgi:hypothetical protein